MFFAITHSRENLVYMGCESAGAHRPTIPRSANAKGRNSSGSKKQSCMFQVKLHAREPGRWRIVIADGRQRHNHDLGNYAHWHTSTARLTDQERVRVVQMLRSGMTPIQSLVQLQDEFRNNCSTLQHIYIQC